MNHKCKKHDIDLLCMAGCSAHPDNWYCPQCDRQEQYKRDTTKTHIDRLLYVRARYRLLFNCCPLCNSDAPELDTCPICNSYHQARGDQYPPSMITKQKWLKEYINAINMRALIKRSVQESRNKRNNSRGEK